MRLPLLIAAIAALSGAAFAQNASLPSAPEATIPAPPPAAGQRGAVMQACRADFQSLCAGMVPGDGKFGPCVRANRDKVSPSCQAALQSIRATRLSRQMPQPLPQPQLAPQ